MWIFLRHVETRMKIFTSFMRVFIPLSKLCFSYPVFIPGFHTPLKSVLGRRWAV